MGFTQVYNGMWQNAAGTRFANGTAYFALSQDASVSGSAQISDQEVSFALDSTGSIPLSANAKLWTNDALTPSGTVYAVRVEDFTGNQIWGPQNFSIVGAGPINLATFSPASALVSYPGVVLLDPSADQTIEQFNLLPAAGNTTQSLGAVGAPWNAVLNNVSVKSLENALFADQFSGADIFAQANSAAASLSGPGIVVIPPGTYNSVTTTLNGISGIVFFAYGATVNFSATSGNATTFKSVSRSGIYGLTLNGPNTGTGVGLYLGNSATGASETLYNAFVDLQIGGNDATALIKGFYHGVQLDGATGSGTYTNLFLNVNVYASLSHGWYIVPTSALYANANSFVSCSAQHGAADGFYIDKCWGNWFYGARSETNGGNGAHLGVSSATEANFFSGGWFEGNTTSDFNLDANAVGNSIYGVIPNSATPLIVNGGAFGNVCEFSGSNGFPAQTGQRYGTNWLYTANPGTGANIIFEFYNSESPSSGITNVFQWERTSANNGLLALGSPEYPVQLNSKIASYNQIATAGNGVPAEVFQVLATAQAANYNSGSPKTLFTPTASAMYRISAVQSLTQAATNSSTFPSLTLSYTDAGGIARTVTMISTSATNATSVTTSTNFPIFTNNSTPVTVTSAGYASSGATPMQFALAITAEAL
jgi:hypothetical protein